MRMLRMRVVFLFVTCSLCVDEIHPSPSHVRAKNANEVWKVMREVGVRWGRWWTARRGVGGGAGAANVASAWGRFGDRGEVQKGMEKVGRTWRSSKRRGELNIDTGKTGKS